MTHTIVQLVLFAAFAAGIYIFVTGTFDFDAAESDGAGALNAAEQGFANLRTGLVVLYGVLLILVPLARFLMARAALTPLQKSYDLQQRFVDGASHEMRSPLRIIQGELELALLTTARRLSMSGRCRPRSTPSAASPISPMTSCCCRAAREPS